MELIPFPGKSGAPNPRVDGNSTGELVVPEGIINYRLSEDDDVLSSYNDPHHYEEMLRDSLSVFLESMEYAMDDVPEMPPAYIVQYPDFLEKAWGWERLIPFVPSFVEWSAYKAYLVEYSRKNYGEVGALCCNNKPYEDKNYFVHLANKKPYPDGQVTAPDCDALQANHAASLCIAAEHNFRLCFKKALSAEEVRLSYEIEKFADHVINSVSKSSAATSAGLVCIAKETELLFELMEECMFNTHEMIALSKKIRQSAYLMLVKGPESAAAIGAMVGMAKEAKIVRYLLTRVDRCMGLDYDLSDTIRKNTEIVFTSLLEEFSCKNISNDDGGDTSASVKSENPMGVSTVGFLNGKESVSVQDYKVDVNEYYQKDNNAKFCSTIIKDIEPERGGIWLMEV